MKLKGEGQPCDHRNLEKLQNVVLFRGNSKFVLQHHNGDHFFTGAESDKEATGEYKREEYATDKKVTSRPIMTKHTHGTL